MKVAEAQSAHRMDLEKRVINSQRDQSGRGQWFALVIGLAGIGCATYAALNGQAVFGGILGGTTLVSLVGAFLASRHFQNVDLAQKHQQMLPPQKHPQQGKKKKGR